MYKKNKVSLITGTIIVSISLFGVSTFALSGDNIKEKVSKLKSEFNNKKEHLEKVGTYNTNTEEATNIKKLGLEIAELNESSKTEQDYKLELENALVSVKRGLIDTKEYQKNNYDEKTQKFIEKLEHKIAKIELDMKDKSKSSKELLKWLRDRSDTDN